MAIDWGLGLNMPNPGNAFLQGLEQGRQRRIETETGNAFSSLMTNPGDTQALGVLARYRPKEAMHFQQQNAATAQAARESDIRVRAAAGDPDAVAELPGVDWNAWSKLDEGTRKQAKEAVEFIGQAALAIDRLPNEDERRRAWAEYVQIAGQRGIDVPPEYQQYSPAILQATLAEAKEMQTALTAREPKYLSVPEGGGVVNVRDPNAVQQWNSGVQAGGGVTEGATATNPQTGERIIFRNGQWVPATGGASGNAGGNFR